MGYGSEQYGGDKRNDNGDKFILSHHNYDCQLLAQHLRVFGHKKW